MANKGPARHFAKMAMQSTQLNGQGAMTGGLATSTGAPKVSNKAAKTKSLGKNC